MYYKLNRPALKAEARRIIREGRPSVLKAGGIFFLMQAVLFGLLMWNTWRGAYFVDGVLYFAESTPVQMFLDIFLNLLTLLLGAGFTLFLMELRRGLEPPYAAMFDSFSIMGRVIWLQINVSVRVFLWSLLFTIPGIVATYRYRFALYNLLENPELSASQAIALSKVQTYGMKMELFVCDLSFVGWNIVSLFTLALLNIWLTPYMVLTDLEYYEAGKARVSPHPGGQPPRQDLPW